VADADSYRSIGYLLLGLPFGVIWFTALVTGASVGVSMLVVALAGIPMLVGMWYAARAFANVERGLANALLHQRLGYPGIATATAAVAALSTALWVAWAPFHARIVSDHPFGHWSGSSDLENLTSSTWSWLLVPLGVLLLVLAFHLLNAIAGACGRWTASALAIEDASEASA
jgi:hypothetical protein